MVFESLGHLFLVSFPTQGHVNHLLRLGKILASKGFLVTFSTTETTGEQMRYRKASDIIDKLTPFGDGFIRFEFFADGWEEDKPRRRDLDQCLLQLELVGKQVIPQMIKKNAEQGRPVSCLINNPFIPWVTDVAISLGLPYAMLWVQSCACFASYYHFYHGTVPFPDEEHPEIDVQLPDNSGARELMCIRIIGTSNRRNAHIGDVIIVVIKEAVPNSPPERSEVIRVVIVCTSKELKHDNGMIIQYDDNAAVAIDQEGNPKGT
ncbi:limonoid UDP-glucosyltransferase-like [Populus alba x Populus x berolinensis]|nr:limonoid UDP-glucosyltransferase-like [Populus alba x Populus x berolinensis]